MVLENVGPTFREAERLLTEYFADGGYMPHERKAILNVLRTLKTGEFCISPSAIFELWDILGMIPGKSDNLANLYIMLGVMNSIHNDALYGAGDDDDEEEELSDAELN